MLVVITHKCYLMTQPRTFTFPSVTANFFPICTGLYSATRKRFTVEAPFIWREPPSQLFILGHLHSSISLIVQSLLSHEYVHPSIASTTTDNWQTVLFMAMLLISFPSCLLVLPTPASTVNRSATLHTLLPKWSSKDSRSHLPYIPSFKHILPARCTNSSNFRACWCSMLNVFSFVLPHMVPSLHSIGRPSITIHTLRPSVPLLPQPWYQKLAAFLRSHPGHHPRLHTPITWQPKQ